MIINKNNSEGALSKQSNRLWSLFGELQKYIRIDDSYEMLISLAVVAKLTPDEFKELYKSPKISQKDNLCSFVSKHEKLKNLDSINVLMNKSLSPDALAEMIYYLNDVNDFSEFADIICQAISAARGKRGSEISTSPSVIEIIKKYIGDVKQLSIYDGAAGLCALTSNIDSSKLILEEINSTARNMGKNLLLLKDINANYKINNSLLNASSSVRADMVITQPPWGLRIASHDLEAIRRANYLVIGKDEKIPSSASDALWIQQALYQTNKKGKVIMLMPHGWLFRGGYDAVLREYLLEHDLIDAIIGLPAGLMQHTSIPSVILILNKNKEKSHKGTVHFVDASNFGENIQRYKLITAEEIDLIVSLAKGEQPEHENYKAALLPEIYKNNNSLNIRLYVEKEMEIEMPEPKIELEKLKTAQEKYTNAQAKLLATLNKIN